MERIRALLIDIDGVLTVSWHPLPGAVDAVRWLRDNGYPFAFLTNTTSRTRASIAETLSSAGFPIEAPEVFTAPAVAASYLREHHPGARCFLLNSGDIAADLAGVDLVGDEPDVVLVGGAGPEFGYAELNRVFRYLQGGARLVALHRNLYWRTEEGMRLDTGAFLAGLEQAAGVEAEVVGKPSGAFFATALTALGTEPGATAMIGDDIEADVLAAQRHGLIGILVKTGKYRPETHRSAPEPPDHVLDGFADLPAFLGRLP
ncbi:TIGR01458 family HAD-type hydrolase [Amycolatopsis rhizosphaerae]|uniref:Haloacid dehalogenase-like hydrolase domain-containing protein 2 n=1 Tax=Amycolatopsis rhizosphaerae TaxID=2053003 RepID=A0A558AJI4_9PSEU|nr:TIGR01458 family HAD-type hydrolase [Amycolatopsis rhizosphaerae]TVT24428.1 TIGR01458 family HAD-type hydrolase [Amycolatopsis rhizosphaerae]